MGIHGPAQNALCFTLGNECGDDSEEIVAEVAKEEVSPGLVESLLDSRLSPSPPRWPKTLSSGAKPFGGQRQSRCLRMRSSAGRWTCSPF